MPPPGRVRPPGAGVALALTLAACGAPPPDPPTAAIAVDPPAVCFGDDFSTTLAFDGTASAVRLTLVPTPPAEGDLPLTFRWSFAGSEHRVVGGDPESALVDVQISGDRPLHATLDVVHAFGGAATSTRTVGLTLPEAAACAGESCGAGRVCLAVGDRSFCADDVRCDHDGECSACLVCDAEHRRCLPPTGAP